MKLRIGLIGAGNRGVKTFGAFIGARDDAEIAAICDPNGERARAALGVLGINVPLYAQIEAMIAAENLDGVVITTPDFLHAPNVVQALAKGVRYILVDKPLAISVEGCRDVRDAAQKNGGSVAMGFNLRHIPVISTVKQLVDAGEIGDLMLIENREFYDAGRTYFARWNGRREFSGGLWIHKGSHDFDIYNWWNEKGIPLRVTAMAGVNAMRPDKIPFAVEPEKPVGPHCTACAYADICPDYSPPVGGTALYNDQTTAVDGYRQDKCIYLSNSDVHDNGFALVEYSNNVRASHMECFVSGFVDRRYTLVGDRGVITASLAEPERIEIRPRWGTPKWIDVPPAPEGGHGGGDPLLVESFINEMKRGAQPSSTIRDGLRSVAIGQAAEIAWREKRSVDISELVSTDEL